MNTLFSLAITLSVFCSACAQAPQQQQNQRQAVVAEAEHHLGTAYRYSSCTPEKGFDCSGFVYYVFKSFEISVPRSSKGYRQLSQTTLQNAQIADIIVFTGYKDKNSIGHVGIITKIENGKLYFIHASTYKGVITSELYSSSYKDRFLFVVNVLK